MPSDTPVFVIFAALVVIIILLAILTSWQTPGKGPLGPSKGGYRPSEQAEGPSIHHQSAEGS